MTFTKMADTKYAWVSDNARYTICLAYVMGTESYQAWRRGTATTKALLATLDNFEAARDCCDADLLARAAA